MVSRLTRFGSGFGRVPSITLYMHCHMLSGYSRSSQCIYEALYLECVIMARLVCCLFVTEGFCFLIWNVSVVPALQELLFKFVSLKTMGWDVRECSSAVVDVFGLTPNLCHVYVYVPVCLHFLYSRTRTQTCRCFVCVVWTVKRIFFKGIALLFPFFFLSLFAYRVKPRLSDVTSCLV